MFDSKWFVDHEVKLPLDEQQDRILRKRPNPADLNLAVERPFINFFRADLINFISTALNRPHPAIELATLALDEARLRFQKSKPRKLKEITKLFKDSEISPINWLANARHAVKEYKNKETKDNLQKFFDYCIRQIELSIREIGYGDATINKKMKEYVNLLFSIIDKINEWENIDNVKKKEILKIYIQDMSDFEIYLEYFEKYRIFLSKNSFNNLTKDIINL